MLDKILSSMFADIDGELCFIGGGTPIPLDSDDQDLIAEAFTLLIEGDEE